MKTALKVLLFSLWSSKVLAQCDADCGPNLVPNGELENFFPEVCENLILPELYSDVTPVADWLGGAESFGPSLAFTPDYFNPDCNMAFPAPGVGGSAALGLFTITIPGDPSSEWIQVQLTEPLIEGTQYCISFFVFTPLELSVLSDGLDVALLNQPINQSPDGDGDNPVNFTPAYSNPAGEFLPTELTEFSFNYCAQGGEEWLAFGNQNADLTITSEPNQTAYIIIDNVSLNESCSQGVVEFELETDLAILDCNQCANISTSFSDSDEVQLSWNQGLGEVIGPVEVCPNETTTYTATVLTEVCNSEEPVVISESITIEVDCDENLQVQIEDVTICAGEGTVLEATVNGGLLPYTFEWSTLNSDTPFLSVNPSESTTYSLTVTDNTGNQVSETVLVSVIANDIELNLGDDLVLCSGEVQTLNPELDENLDYLWSDGSSMSTLEIFQSGEYWVSVSTPCQMLSDTVLVTEPYASLNQFQEINGCEGEELAIGFSPNDNIEVLWENGYLGDSILITESGIYSAEILSDECTVAFPVEIFANLTSCSCDVFIPNAFTPDGDGLNELFEIKPDCDLTSFDLKIYNHWGEEIFSSLSPDVGWNGSVNNGDYYSPNSVYVYILKLSFLNNNSSPETLNIRGHVSLLR